MIDSRVSAPPRGVRAIARDLGAVVYGEPVYCLSCAKPDGYVTVDLPPGVIYLCGECEVRFGVPPEMVARPDIDQETHHGLV